MTATDDAPDPRTTTEDRWQHIEDRLAAIERRIREQSSAAIATLDTCLTRLDALHHDLTHRPWPPQASPTPPDPPDHPPQTVRTPAARPFGPAGHRPTQTGPDTSQHHAADSHRATGGLPA
ncbi:hypothetical protein [Kitasatospora purpeofusca]|uniref:hypothetical protein n=1 Tax=Kitasatospora purpeofusca TaxID=67352 RepID=UPI0004BF6E39|nr:hypothetical protein [Kitasatospora purpeofusca]